MISHSNSDAHDVVSTTTIGIYHLSLYDIYYKVALAAEAGSGAAADL